jgi:RecJ-like exonuclease
MEDRTNWYPTPCPRCDGYGAIGHTVTVYEHGCAFPHPDTEEIPCPECKGDGQVLVEYQPVLLEDGERP